MPSVVSTRTYVGYEVAGDGVAPRRVERELRAPGPGEVVVQVAGCGLCHTDLGFAYDGVRTRHPLPLILGHEISGIVESAGDTYAHLVGRAVIVPAVLPCGECRECQRGRPMICARQVMPGNDADGGFATHTIVPGRGVCPVPGASANPDAPLGKAPGLTLRHLAVVADAVSTAYQSVLRSGLAAGDVVAVVGLGGVGGYAAQIAAERWARVVGLDPDASRLEAARRHGAALTLDPTGLSPKELRKRIQSFARENGASETGWTILECSGTAEGQSTAFGLLVPGATLMVVGYTMSEVSLRLSNLMAFDARVLGNWGCAPEHYPAILEKVLPGRYDVVGATELRPLTSIASAFEDVRNHRVSNRLVLVPDV